MVTQKKRTFANLTLVKVHISLVGLSKKKNGWAVTFWSPNVRRSLNLKTGSQITIPKKVTLGIARRLVVLFKKSSLCFCPVQFMTLSVELEKFVPGDMLFTPATRVAFLDLNHPETFPQKKRGQDSRKGIQWNLKKWTGFWISWIFYGFFAQGTKPNPHQVPG